MPEVTVGYVVQRRQFKKNGEPTARGWHDWSYPNPDEESARETLGRAREFVQRVEGKTEFRLVKIEERREVIG